MHHVCTYLYINLLICYLYKLYFFNELFLKFKKSSFEHKRTYLQNQTHRTDLWLPRGRRGSGRMEWKFGVSRCKPVYIEWVNNEILLYSTKIYIQYPVINHNGNNIKVHLCITESQFCTAEINTTL